jgi:hypothetical protein
VEEQLQPAPVHTTGREPLHAVRRLYPGHALRQQHRRPHLGAGPRARHFSGGIDGIAVKRQACARGEDRPQLGHMLRLDGHDLAHRVTSGRGARRERKRAHSHGDRSQRSRDGGPSRQQPPDVVAGLIPPPCHCPTSFPRSPVLRRRTSRRLDWARQPDWARQRQSCCDAPEVSWKSVPGSSSAT